MPQAYYRHTCAKRHACRACTAAPPLVTRRGLASAALWCGAMLAMAHAAAGAML